MDGGEGYQRAFSVPFGFGVGRSIFPRLILNSSPLPCAFWPALALPSPRPSRSADRVHEPSASAFSRSDFLSLAPCGSKKLRPSRRSPQSRPRSLHSLLDSFAGLRQMTRRLTNPHYSPPAKNADRPARGGRQILFGRPRPALAGRRRCAYSGTT